ncbi:MAG: dihydrodipicolinate synthase family protein [Clostridiales bacterium]|nr:dihydrodipicolinate synthase family protein [Clostridiales bacterium]
MENNILFRGIMPALVSPVDENGKIKESAVREIMRWQLSQGVDGFYLSGSTGEGFLLRPEERMKLLETALEEAGSKAKIIVHTGAIDLPTTLELTRHASDAGADAVSSVSPIYFQYGEDEIFNYYKAMADAACGTPLLMYCYGTGKLSFDMVKRLMSIDNIIGLKWTFQDYYTLIRIKNINGGNINVINGPDESLICGLAAGADAGIGTTYNVMPKLFVELYREFKAGNIENAMKIQKALTSVIEVMLKYQVIAAAKAMLCELGFDAGQCNKPIRQLDSDERVALMREASEFVDFKEQKILI